MSLSDLKSFTLSASDSGSTYEYEICYVQNIRSKQERPAIGIEPPGVAAKNNTYIGVQGQTRDLTINFRLHNDLGDSNSDKSNGTAPQDGTFADSDGDGVEDVVTIDEQITYLFNYMQPGSLGVEWILSGGRFGSSGINIYFETVELDEVNRVSPKWREATIRAKLGQGF